MRLIVLGALAAAATLMGGYARADGNDATCAKYEVLIENSLKDIAADITSVTVDEVDAFLQKTSPPGVVKPARIASAWGQIHAALAHMPQLGCKPYPHALDPSAYFTALFKCNNARPKGGAVCRRSTWERTDWVDDR